MALSRKIKTNPIKLPKDRVIIDYRKGVLLREMCHVPGQAAAIRFFDKDSRNDYEALMRILSSKEVKSWMDDTRKLTYRDYQEWAGREKNDSFLFAVHDSRMSTLNGIRKVRGFVYIYSERVEKFRIKRLIKTKLLPAKSKRKTVLEVSMAIMMGEGGGKVGSGLMSSALRQSCLEVRSLLGYPKESDLMLYAFVDQENPASARVIEASGFVRKGSMKYDSDSPEESSFYLLSWRKLHSKIKGALLKLYEEKKGVIREAQMTDSHCGPAVLKAMLGFFGHDVSQEMIVKTAGVEDRVEEHGMKPSQMAMAAEILAPELKFWFKQGANSRDIRRIIKKYKFPVAVDWQGLFYDTVAEEKKFSRYDDHGHYSIIIDIERNKDEITLDDPYSEFFGKPRIFSYRWFTTRWWDVERIDDEKNDPENIFHTRKMLFLLAPADLEWPQDLGLRPAGDLEKIERGEEENLSGGMI